MFSPPYGDGTLSQLQQFCMYPFSPPYGDGTDRDAEIQSYLEFSPPYGDGTLNISQKIVKWKS